MFFLLFLLDDRRIQIRIRISDQMDPDPGGPKTYGSCGSGSATLPNKALKRYAFSDYGLFPTGTVPVRYLYISGCLRWARSMHMSQRSASLPPKSEKVAPGFTGSTCRSFFFFTPPGVRAGRSAARSHEAGHWFQKSEI
jgi:hypothetical protein